VAAGLDDVRRIALGLPRAYEAVVRDHVKFRVGQIVFASVSPDESLLGFAFPRDEREALVDSNPKTFLMPADSDLRYQWVQLRLGEVEVDELTELVVEAWRMVVPRKVSDAYDASRPTPPA
jgi:hypothetical protein